MLDEIKFYQDAPLDKCKIYSSKRTPGIFAKALIINSMSIDLRYYKYV